MFIYCVFFIRKWGKLFFKLIGRNENMIKLMIFSVIFIFMLICNFIGYKILPKNTDKDLASIAVMVVLVQFGILSFVYFMV
jgi:hypothetical protein